MFIKYLQVQFGAAPIWMNVNSDFLLEAKLFGRYTWTDDRLGWNPEDYDGVKSIRVDTSRIWTPDVVLYNKG